MVQKKTRLTAYSLVRNLGRQTMNINDFVLAKSAQTYLNLNSGTQGSANVGGSASAGLQKAEKRVQSQVDVTSAQLSSFGALASSVSNVKLAAQSLGRLADTSASAAFKTAADGFVSAFNSAIHTSAATAAVSGESAASRSANRVAVDFTRAVSGNVETLESLKKMGFSAQPDGTLALDTQQFGAAQKADPAGVKATLAEIAQQVDKIATQELTAAGNVSNAMAALNQLAAVLKSQQSGLAALQHVPTTHPSSGYALSGGFGWGAYPTSPTGLNDL
jgi:hypothetical protein